jgi:hypothetical protein
VNQKQQQQQSINHFNDQNNIYFSTRSKFQEIEKKRQENMFSTWLSIRNMMQHSAHSTNKDNKYRPDSDNDGEGQEEQQQQHDKYSNVSTGGKDSDGSVMLDPLPTFTPERNSRSSSSNEDGIKKTRDTILVSEYNWEHDFKSKVGSSAFIQYMVEKYDLNRIPWSQQSTSNQNAILGESIIFVGDYHKQYQQRGNSSTFTVKCRGCGSQSKRHIDVRRRCKSRAWHCPLIKNRDVPLAMHQMAQVYEMQSTITTTDNNSDNDMEAIKNPPIHMMMMEEGEKQHQRPSFKVSQRDHRHKPNTAEGIEGAENTSPPPPSPLRKSPYFRVHNRNTGVNFKALQRIKVRHNRDKLSKRIHNPDHRNNLINFDNLNNDSDNDNSATVAAKNTTETNIGNSDDCVHRHRGYSLNNPIDVSLSLLDSNHPTAMEAMGNDDTDVNLQHQQQSNTTMIMTIATIVVIILMLRVMMMTMMTNTLYYWKQIHPKCKIL